MTSIDSFQSKAFYDSVLRKRGTYCLLLYSLYKAHTYLGLLGESKHVTESATAYIALGFSIWLSNFISTRWAG